MVHLEKYTNSYVNIILEGEGTYNNSISKIDKYFAKHPDGYMFTPRWKNRRFTHWDGKVHLLKCVKDDYNILPLGLVKDLIHFLQEKNIEFTCSKDIGTCFFSDKNHDFESFYSWVENTSGLSPRDYQRRMLELALKHKRQCYRAATGAGKTLTLYMIGRYLLNHNKNFRILLIVPNIGLVTQTYNNFKDDYNWTDLDKDVGMIYGKLEKEEKEESLKKSFVISTWQSLQKYVKSDPEYFLRYNCVLLDEMHTAKNEEGVINSIMRLAENAEYRIGVTGTIPKNDLYVNTLIGNFGDIKQIISTKELIDRGELTKAFIHEVRINYTENSVKYLRKAKIKRDTEYELVHNCHSTDYAIGELIKKGYIKKDQNTLILMRMVANKEMSEMVDYIKENFPDFHVEIVNGKIDFEKREEIRTSVEKNKGEIIVATYKTFGVGINMKNLHNVIFASSTKSYVDTLQSIGRGLRLHKSKQATQIFDINHNLSIEINKHDGTKDYWRSYLNKDFASEGKSRLAYYIEEKHPIDYIQIDKTFDLLEGLNVS